MNTDIDFPRPYKAHLMRPIHAVSTCIVFLLIAFLINKFFYTESLISMLQGGKPLLTQLGFGMLIGSGYALLSLFVFMIGGRYIAWVGQVWAQMIRLLDKADLSGLNFIWFSISAGIGEELLFRGALQPIIGMWWTAVIFVLFHSWTGEINSVNWKKLIYLATTFAASVMLSCVCIYFGLVAAIIAHISIDIILMFVGKQLRGGNEQQESR